MSDQPNTTPRAGWDLALMVATVALLGGLGVQSLAGTLYVWWASRADAAWAEGPGYAAYVSAMNAIAAPMAIALVVVMGLCVPRRLLERRALVAVSVLLVAAGAAGWAVTGSPVTGAAVYLIGAGALQLAVVVLAAAGARGVTFVTEGRITRVGSGLLHLGLIVFGYLMVAMQTSPWMLPAFAVAFVLAIGGSAMSFWAGAIARAGAGDSS